MSAIALACESGTATESPATAHRDASVDKPQPIEPDPPEAREASTTEPCCTSIPESEMRALVAGYVEGDPPPATGGTIGPGTWKLTKITIYVGDAGLPDAAPEAGLPQMITLSDGAKLALDGIYLESTTSLTGPARASYCARGTYTPSSVGLLDYRACSNSVGEPSGKYDYSADDASVRLSKRCAQCTGPVSVYTLERE
jgi:hypothetical protein